MSSHKLIRHTIIIIILSVFKSTIKQSKVSDSSIGNYKSTTNISNKLKNSSNNHFSNSHISDREISGQNIHNQSLNHVYSGVNFNFANIQTKSKVSQPDDPLEKEADRVAEQVMRMESSDESQIHRRCESCEEEESKKVKISRNENTYSSNQFDVSENVAEISTV